MMFKDWQERLVLGVGSFCLLILWGLEHPQQVDHIINFFQTL